jgi:hypothetical protein
MQLLGEFLVFLLMSVLLSIFGSFIGFMIAQPFVSHVTGIEDGLTTAGFIGGICAVIGWFVMRK